jgi:hypothetical protein
MDRFLFRVLVVVFALDLSACEDEADQRPDTVIEQDASAVTAPDAGGTQHDAGLQRDAGMGRDAGASDAGSDAAVRDAGETSELDAGLSACPPLYERAVVDIAAGRLPEELTHFSCDKTYVLNGIVFVYADDPEAPQVLTIDPGTVIQGQDSPRGFLVVTRNGRIEAEGTARDPIVFTSARPEGSRARDDWGGITLLGRATAGGTRRTEGFPASVDGASIDSYLAYGPLPDGDAGSAEPDDAHDCGTLRYVRVEFASFNAGGAMGNESNALQIYACGFGTTIDHVQSHLSGDDGIEIFGGAVDLRHVLITGASDDGLDWDDGWRGRAQFVVVQQHPDLADLGFEAGGSSDTPALAPDPRLFNVTLIGTGGAGTGKVGGRLRGASRGVLRNFVIMGFTAGALDIGGAATGRNFRDGLLSVESSVFFRGGASTSFPLGADDTADDVDPHPGVTDNIDEAVELTQAGTQNRELDPQLAAPFDHATPSFVPAAGAPLGAAAAAEPSEAPGDDRPPFFDRSAEYVGAFEPGGDDWTRGWSAFPAH